MSKEVGTPRYLSLVVPLKKIGDEAVHKELGDIMERAATIASSLEAKQDSGSGPRCQDIILGDNDPPLSRGYILGSGEDNMKLLELIELFNVAQLKLNAAKLKINAVRLKLVLPVFVYAAKHTVSTAVQVPAVEEIIDFLKASSVHYALTVNTIIYTSCTKQFWATAKVQTVNGVRQLQALVDKKRVIITKLSIRSDLHLEDAGGTDCLPTATIFEELARMGAKSTAWNEFSSTMASLIICLATNQKFNPSKYIFDAMVKHLDGGVKFLMYPCFLQVFINQQLRDMSHHKKIFVNPSHTKKVFANMKRVGKDFSGRITPLFDTMMVQASKELGEDLDHPTDSNQIPIVDQPSTSSQPKKKQKSKKAQRDAQAQEIPDLKKRVQRLERKKKSRTSGLKRLKKVDIDAYAEVTMVNETQERQDEDLMFDTGVLDDDEVFVDVTTSDKDDQSTKLDDSIAGEAVTTASVEGSAAPTTIEQITLAQTLIQIKEAKPKVVTTVAATAATTTTTTRRKARGVVIQEPKKIKLLLMKIWQEIFKEAELIEEEKLARKQEE
ncbi:hypothetical protein Tco_1396367 [Tanacetum coccineum]